MWQDEADAVLARLEAAVARHPAGKARRPCHCLCRVAHPGASWPCAGKALTSRLLVTDLLGPVDVPLCGPCALMQGVTGGSHHRSGWPPSAR
jgi:hypothetical protein